MKKRILSIILTVAMVFSVIPVINTDHDLITTTYANTQVNYARLLQTSLYFYDGNMCGPDVETRSAFAWRNNCHLQDATISIPDNMRGNSGRTTINVSGGFHDAGDHVKFNLPIAYAGTTVGWAVHEYRAEFEKAGSLGHAQRVLDHFAEYFRRCVLWNAAGTEPIAYVYQVGDGGGGEDHGFWGPPEGQTGSMRGATRRARWTNLTSANPGSDQVYIAAALLAANYANFGNPEDLRVARALFNWANSSSTHNGIASEGTDGFYNSQRWEDKRALAGEWLRIATGDNSFRITSPSPQHNSWPMSWDGVWQQVLALRGDWTTLRSGFFQNLDSRASNATAYWHVDQWGAARYNTAFQMLGLMHDEKTSGNRYGAWADFQMRFLLGANSQGNTYVIGYPTIGTNASPSLGVNGQNINVHHRAATGGTARNGGPPGNSTHPQHLLTGGLVSGPNASGQFTNDYNHYQSTEVACDYNATLVGAAAAHLRRNPSHMPVPVNQIPGSFRTVVDPVACECNLPTCDRCNPCTCRTCGCTRCFNEGKCMQPTCVTCVPTCTTCNVRPCACVPPASITLTLNAVSQGNNNWAPFSQSVTVTRDGTHTVTITGAEGNWYRDLSVTATGLTSGISVSLGNLMFNQTAVTHSISSPLNSGNAEAVFHQAWGDAGNLITRLTGGHTLGGDGNQQAGLSGNPLITTISLNFTVSGAGGGPVVTTTSPPIVTTTPPIIITTEPVIFTTTPPITTEFIPNTHEPITTTFIDVTPPPQSTPITTTPTDGSHPTVPPITTTNTGAIYTPPPPVSTTPENGGQETEPPVTTTAPRVSKLGDVDGNNMLTIGDALEILMYLAGLPSTMIHEVNNPRAWNAALITGGDKPSISDALEILMYLAGMDGILKPIWD
jgi:hypothetical protein